MASGIVVVKQYERLVVLKWGRLESVATTPDAPNNAGPVDSGVAIRDR